jgi:hypothetical protein
VALVQSKQLISEVAKVVKLKNATVRFIIERYLDHATNSLMHGYPVSGCNRMRLKIASIRFTEIPARHRRRFRYSDKIFGHAYLPMCVQPEIKKLGYNFRPCRKILDRIADFANTDAIYTLTKR